MTSGSEGRRVVESWDDGTRMWVASYGDAKAFAKQLIRDSKGFSCRPREYDSEWGWEFIVYEENEPKGIYY